jgi:hypothetical protein
LKRKIIMSELFDRLQQLSAPAGEYVELGVESNPFNGNAFYVVITVKNKGVALEPGEARVLAESLLDMADAAEKGEEDWKLWGAQQK